MKKKGLLITLISTIVVVAVIGGLSIGKLFSSPEDPNAGPGSQVSNKVSNEGNNKGSKADPYYIYDTETFTTLLSTYGNQTKPYREAVMDPVMIDVVENGVTVSVQKKDEQGNPVFEPRKDENGYVVYKTVEGILEPYHFELKNDIDFAGVDFKVLFNNNNAFTGVIDGKGFTVKNITINITKENLEKNMFTKGDSTKSYAHIGIFGDMRDASVKNINFDAVKIDIANDVYSYLQEGAFWDKYHTSLVELSIGSIAACVERTTIEANVNATINADSYSVYEENENQCRNCVGGIVGYAIDSKISSSNNTLSSIKIIADSGSKNYYIGGVAGYMFGSEFSNLKVSSEITASAIVKSQILSNKLWIGGVSGYMLNSTIEDSIVNLKVNQLVDEERLTGTGVVKVNNGLYNMIGGIVSVIRANSAEQTSTISNVRVTSDVDMDALFGGAVFEVKSTYSEEEADAREAIFVKLEDLVIKSTVKSLMAYGVASKLLYTDISYTEEFVCGSENNSIGEPTNYNIYLAGKTVLNTQADQSMIVAGYVCTNTASPLVHVSLSDLKIMVSYENYSQLGLADKARENLLGNLSYVAAA